MAIITEHYFDDAETVEQLLYAKSLKRPFLVVRFKDSPPKNDIPDLFNGVDIIADVTLERGNVEKIAEVVSEKIKEWSKKNEKKK